jgi:hypothetical protein
MTLPIVLALLAIWRLARLLIVDEITRPLREAVIARGGDKLAYLVTCPWCISVWVGWPLLLGPIYFPDNRVLLLVNAALAGSLAAGLGQTVEDRLDR